MLLSLRANYLDWTEVIPSLRSAPLQVRPQSPPAKRKFLVVIWLDKGSVPFSMFYK